jgi:lipopolysaccharide biosynthesis regulator YciM
MKYPTFELMQKVNGKSENEMIMELIYSSIESVYDEDNVYYMKDNTKEEIVDFVDNLQQKDLDKIRVFFETMPKIKKNIDYKCKKCGYNENLTLEGIQSFFE